MNRYLFVIDYQNDFVDGALGFPGAEALDAGIAAKVRAYGPGHVLFTRDTHFDNYLGTREGRLLPVPHCLKGTHGWELYGETAVAVAEVNAPAIDIERAVPKPKLTCERVNISLPIIPSWSIIRPPNLYCACATFIDTTAITAANVKEKIFFIFAHYF